MRKDSRFFRFQISSARKTKSGLTVSGIILQGHIEINGRVYFCQNSQCSECFVNSIWQNGKSVRDCHQGKTAIISLVSSLPFDLSLDDDFRNTYLSDRKCDLSLGGSTVLSVDVNSKLEKSNTRQDSIPEYSNLVTVPHNRTRNAEKEYLKNLRISISNGGYISPTEVYVLDKIRVSLGLDASIADKLAQEYISRLPTDEAETQYYEAVAVCLLDRNYISDSERYLLRNLRMYLGVSEERAASIEKLADWDKFA